MDVTADSMDLLGHSPQRQPPASLLSHPALPSFSAHSTLIHSPVPLPLRRLVQERNLTTVQSPLRSRRPSDLDGEESGETSEWWERTPSGIVLCDDCGGWYGTLRHSPIGANRLSVPVRLVCCSCCIACFEEGGKKTHFQYTHEGNASLLTQIEAHE